MILHCDFAIFEHQKWYAMAGLEKEVVSVEDVMAGVFHIF